MSGAHGNIDAQELAKFAGQAARWWDGDGAFAALHRMNPVRMAFVRGALAALGREVAGLRILDVGCGGGLMCEPLARLGAQVVGIDAGEEAVAAAREHAREEGLEIDYRVGQAGALAGERFDAVLALELVEHVPDAGMLVRECAAALADGGVMFVGTLNRTAKSFLLGIVAAEHVLGWVPRGTHEWRRFVRPEELEAMLAGAGMRAVLWRGVRYSLGRGVWEMTGDLGVNYMMCAKKGPAGAGAA